jgi:hypothetical protein
LRGRHHVPHDEDLFSRPNQAELAPRELLDGGRIFSQPPGFLAQMRVFGALARDRGGQLVVLLARPHHRQQPTVPDERVYHDDGGDKHEEQMDEPSLQAWPFRGSRPALRFGSDLVFGHVRAHSTTT